jgi:hypothetical protein
MIALQSRNPQVADPSRITAQYANMMNMARQQEAAQLQGERARQEMEFARAGEAREAELQPFKVTEAQSKANSERLKYVMDFYDTSAIALSKSFSPQQAAALGDRMKQMFPEPELQQSIDETVAELNSDPANFEVNREKLLRRTMDAKDQTARDYIKQTTGTEERLISVPEFGGGDAVEVPGSRIQVAPGMTYVRGADGAIYPMPTKGGGSFGTPAPAVGAPGKSGSAVNAGQYGAAIESAVLNLAPGTIVSGRARTQARNAEVGGVADSYHLTDDARDFQPGRGQSLDQLVTNLAPLKQQGFDVVINRNKNLVHVEPGPGMARGAGVSAAAPGGPTPLIPGKPPAPKKGDISPEKRKARDTAVQDLYDAVVDAQKKGHLVSDANSFVANRAVELRRDRPYVPGGTAQKTSLDSIEATAAQLLRQIIEEGTSGTLNAVAEQKLFLRGVGGADSTYETRLKTIRNFARQNGIKLKEPAAAKPKAAPARTPVPRKASGGFTVVKVED